MHTKNRSQKLTGEVQMIRLRVAAAESKLKVLKEQALQAKRRRKEAKQIAQRARKQFKQAKADLSELKQSLAHAETKLFQAGGRALARKTAKAKLVAKRVARPLKKSKAVARPSAPRESLQPRRVTRKKPALAEAEVVPATPADVAAIDPTPSTPPITEPNP